MKISKILFIFGVLFLIPVHAEEKSHFCLAPTAGEDTLSWNVFLSEDRKVDFLSLVKTVRHFKGEKVKVRLVAQNGNEVDFIVPGPKELNEDLEKAVYKKYIAQIYARNFALGNPGNRLYVEISDSQGKRLTDTEVFVQEIISSEFNALGLPFFNKANGGKKIEILSLRDDYTPVLGVGQLDMPIRYLSPEELDSAGEKLLTIGLDVGGQGSSVAIMLNGRDVTDQLFPETENEEEDRKNDRSLRYRYAFAYDHLKKGGTGEEFRRRLVEYVKEITEKVKERMKVDVVHGVYVSMPGAPDYAGDRMGSMGNLSRGFPQDKTVEQLHEANGFIRELREYLGKETSFGFGNDMVGWGLSIANEAGFSDGVGIITGTGIGVMKIENGRDVPGANEGGHQNYLVNEEADPNNPDSVKGSFEVFGGSISGILRIADQKGLIKLITNRFQLQPKYIEVKHLGFLAAGYDPLKPGQSLNENDLSLKRLALDVWDAVEKIEAEHVISLYLLTGKTNFAFGGGTTRGDTGKIRYTYLMRALKQYLKELDLPEDMITVKLVSANAALGAAGKALQVYQEDLAKRCLRENVIYNINDTIVDLRKAMNLSKEKRLFSSENWDTIKDKCPSSLIRDVEMLFPKGKKFYVLKGMKEFLLIDDKGFKVVGFYVPSGKEYYNLIYKHGADLLFPKVNRQVLTDDGCFTFVDSNGVKRKVKILDRELIESDFVTENPIGDQKAGERHGHVRKKSFKILPPKVTTKEEVILKGVFDFQEVMDKAGIDQEKDFYRFYNGLSLEIAYVLKDGVWRIVASAKNSGDHEIPVAFCPHYWLNMNVNGSINRENVRVLMEQQKALWEDDESTHIPYEKRPVAFESLSESQEEKHDMRRGLRVGDRKYNNVYYFGDDDWKRVFFDCPGAGRMVVGFGKNMKNLVFFIPGEADGEYVFDVDTIAAEPSSSGVNFGVMDELGIRESNLILLKPGEEQTFETELFFEEVGKIFRGDLFFENGFSKKVAA